MVSRKCEAERNRGMGRSWSTPSVGLSSPRRKRENTDERSDREERDLTDVPASDMGVLRALRIICIMDMPELENWVEDEATDEGLEVPGLRRLVAIDLERFMSGRGLLMFMLPSSVDDMIAGPSSAEEREIYCDIVH